MSQQEIGKTRLDGTPAVTAKKRVRKTPAKMGRPSVYTPELGDEICALVSEGWSSRKIGQLDTMPEMRTIFRWLRIHDDFRQQYTRAKNDEMPDALQENIHQIAEGTLRGEYDPQAARVAIDAYKWTASKLKPKKYGDKIDHTTNGKDLPTPILGTIQQNYAQPTDVIDLE